MGFTYMKDQEFKDAVDFILPKEIKEFWTGSKLDMRVDGWIEKEATMGQLVRLYSFFNTNNEYKGINYSSPYNYFEIYALNHDKLPTDLKDYADYGDLIHHLRQIKDDLDRIYLDFLYNKLKPIDVVKNALNMRSDDFINKALVERAIEPYDMDVFVEQIQKDMIYNRKSKKDILDRMIEESSGFFEKDIKPALECTHIEFMNIYTNDFSKIQTLANKLF